MDDTHTNQDQEMPTFYHFLKALEEERIPDRFPTTDICSAIDMNAFHAKDTTRERYFMFAIVTRDWVNELARWIGDRKCLEIMAGAGWLAKALNEAGIDVIATDDLSWTYHAKPEKKHVFPIENLNAITAVNTHQDADVLIVSWPYMDNDVVEAIAAWGNEKPIVYIGEDKGGCTATDTFFDHFKENKVIYIPQWPGIHDFCAIGHWEGPTTQDLALAG